MSTSGIVRIKKPLNKSGRRKAEKVLTFLTQGDIRRDCENKYPSFINRKRIPHIVIKPSHHQLRRSQNSNTTTSLLLYCTLWGTQNQIKNILPVITCFATRGYGLKCIKIFSYTGIKNRPYYASKSQNLSGRQASVWTAWFINRAIGNRWGQRDSAAE